MQPAGIAHEIEHPLDLLLAGFGTEVDLEAGLDIECDNFVKVVATGNC